MAASTQPAKDPFPTLHFSPSVLRRKTALLGCYVLRPRKQPAPAHSLFVLLAGLYMQSRAGTGENSFFLKRKTSVSPASTKAIKKVNPAGRFGS